MHDLAVYMKKGILFLFSTGFTSFIVLLLFGLLITFNAISSNIDEVIWIHLLMSLSLEILTSNWLTYSGGTDNLVNSWTYFLLGSLTMTLTVLLYWIYLFLLVLVFDNIFSSIGKFWSCCLSFHQLSVTLKTECCIV